MVSIIVPVFNGEKTLSRCLDSILAQTYVDFEVILVNDGSTDRSWEICEIFAKIDNRIRLFSQSNRGVSAARNIGIKESYGEFLTFVDCDDWIEPFMLSRMVELIESTNVDIVFMNFYYESEDSQYIGVLNPSPLRKKDISSYPLAILLPEASIYYDNVKQDHDILGAACGKLIRKSLLDDKLQFNENLSLAEDCLFYLECFMKAKDIYIDDTPVYHYVQNSDSAIHKRHNNVVQQSEQFFRCFSDFSKKLDGINATIFNNLLKYRCYYDLIRRCVDHPSSDNSFIDKYKILSQDIQNPIYSYSGEIPQFVNSFKKIEICLLKHKCCFLLLLSNRIRNIIKPWIRHRK